MLMRLAHIGITVGFGVFVGVLLGNGFEPRAPVVDGVAAASILVVFAGMCWGFQEQQRQLRGAESQALTDDLTGLGNRRRLMLELARCCTAGARVPTLLALFDLNGFKAFNDTFGHPGGDALLVRLAEALTRAVGPGGQAFRLGGDEFCILAPLPDDGGKSLVAGAAAALSVLERGFDVSCASGAATLPLEAADPGAALRLADARLYAQKRNIHLAAGDTHEELVLTLSVPNGANAAGSVSAFATALAARLGMGGRALTELKLAAELHDLGKLAGTPGPLEKPRALSDNEWQFVREHTVVGQRILAGAPAAKAVGQIIRSANERWDTGGYVDGLAAASIPLAARIIAVCDSYDALVSAGPYGGRSPADAVAELRRCAGRQFDPDVVEAFCALHAEMVGESRLVALGDIAAA
jgi:diguanylate cyclase (GGDEF)-like protein